MRPALEGDSGLLSVVRRSTAAPADSAHAVGHFSRRGPAPCNTRTSPSSGKRGRTIAFATGGRRSGQCLLAIEERCAAAGSGRSQRHDRDHEHAGDHVAAAAVRLLGRAGGRHRRDAPVRSRAVATRGRSLTPLSVGERHSALLAVVGFRSSRQAACATWPVWPPRTNSIPSAARIWWPPLSESGGSRTVPPPRNRGCFMERATRRIAPPVAGSPSAGTGRGPLSQSCEAAATAQRPESCRGPGIRSQNECPRRVVGGHWAPTVCCARF